MSDDTERSVASDGSAGWSGARGSKAERLHDLGMFVGGIYAASANLRDAIVLADALRLVDAKTLATMQAALESLDALPIGEWSKARVIEVFKECTKRAESTRPG